MVTFTILSLCKGLFGSQGLGTCNCSWGLGICLRGLGIFSRGLYRYLIDHGDLGTNAYGNLGTHTHGDILFIIAPISFTCMGLFCSRLR